MKVKRFHQFTDEAKKGLSISMADDADYLIDEVNRGDSHLYKINDSWLITRAETINQKKEFVIVCFEGHDVIKVTKWLINKARLLGFDSVRAHTSNQQFARIIENKIGAKLVEQIFKMDLKNG